MKSIVNDGKKYVDESLTGILRIYSDSLKVSENNSRAIYSSKRSKNRKISIVTGGGYGHLPAFLGYVGEGLCDAVAVGNVFSPPSFEAALEATNAVKTDAGVLFLYGNYYGDSVVFTNVADLLDLEGIPNSTVRISDDLASENRQNRRGIAGMFFAYKIAGACADAGNSLDAVADIAQKVVNNTSSYGAAVSSGRLPASEQPLFKVEEGEVDFGVGLHGEKGLKQVKGLSSKELACTILSDLIDDLGLKSGDRVSLLVNGLGGTATGDLYVIYNDAFVFLREKGIQVVKSFVGDYATSMETQGVSLSLLRIEDDMLDYLLSHANTPFVSIG